MPTNGSGPQNIDITPEMLTTATASVRSQVTSLEQSIGALRTQVNALSWQGTAQLTYAELMLQFNQNATALNNALEGIASGLQGNHMNYTGSEAGNVKALSNVAMTLPPAKLG